MSRSPTGVLLHCLAGTSDCLGKTSGHGYLGSALAFNDARWNSSTA
ncbi:MAG: hypothetical protein ACM3IH_09790 [Sphingobacteriales bacterium]